MQIQMGEKIRELRRTRDVSQETLAEHLCVSFQAVSKWERGETMPDAALIPAIASFFGVSTDELFGFDLYEVERKVGDICEEAYQYRGTDDAKSEAILRDGLLKYPGNDVLLNNLLYVIDPASRSGELIEICKKLIEKTNSDEVRLDALRILGETYYGIGETKLGRETFERLPEIYFTKLGLLAEYDSGEERYRAAAMEQSISLERLLDMTAILGDVLEQRGEKEEALEQYRFALAILNALASIPQTPRTEEWVRECVENMNARISALTV